jgi:hypothetical protein
LVAAELAVKFEIIDGKKSAVELTVHQHPQPYMGGQKSKIFRLRNKLVVAIFRIELDLMLVDFGSSNAMNYFKYHKISQNLTISSTLASTTHFLS